MKSIIYLLFSFLLISCSFNEFYKDRESDKKDGEQITQKFYWEILHGSNQDNIYNLFSDKFFKVTSKEKLDELLSTTNNMGPIQDFYIVKWETLVVKGSDARSQYLFTYDVKRGVETTHETFSMEKDENGDIKIVGYNISQDLSTQ